MPIYEVHIYHDWEDSVAKGVSADILFDALKVLKSATSSLQAEHISDLVQTAPEELRENLRKYLNEIFDEYNPAYRIAFLSVEQGSVKARAIVSSALLSLSIATAGGTGAAL